MTATTTDRSRPEQGERRPGPALRGTALVSIVARHEFGRQWHNAAYWTSTLLAAVLICLAIGIPVLLGGNRDAAPAIGIVGDQPSLTQALQRSAEVNVFQDEASARSALQGQDVDAALLADDRVLVSRTLSGDLARLLQESRLVAEYAERLKRAEGTQGEDVARSLDAKPLQVITLVEDSAQRQERTIAAGTGVFVLIVMLVLFGNSMTQSVAEEKSSRIVELLLAKVEASRLLTGKIIGVGASALCQIMLIMTAATAVALLSGVVSAPREVLGVAVTLLLWFIPAFILFTTIYAVAGALVSSPEDAGHVSGPVTLLQMAAAIGPWLIVSEADPTVTAIVSMLPGISWAAMPVQLAYGDVPVWQVLTAYALMLLTIWVLARVGARAYAGGLLQYGGRVTVDQALRHAQAGRSSHVTEGRP